MVTGCASSVAQLGLSVVLCSGARLSCCHHGQTPLIRLASTLQAAEIQRKSAAEEEREKKGTKRGSEALCSDWLCVCTCTHTGMSVPVVRSKSATCYDHILRDACACVCMCVFSVLPSQSGEV